MSAALRARQPSSSPGTSSGAEFHIVPNLTRYGSLGSHRRETVGCPAALAAQNNPGAAARAVPAHWFPLQLKLLSAHLQPSSPALFASRAGAPPPPLGPAPVMYSAWEAVRRAKPPSDCHRVLIQASQPKRGARSLSRSSARPLMADVFRPPLLCSCASSE